jgi:DHA3 family macrolide efflux protein-like MFS transporter
MLPVFRPLKDRGVLTVWSGLCGSTIGEDLFRVAAVWLAVEAAGNMAGLITSAQYAMMLVVGLAGGVLLDGWRADKAMVWAKVWSALFAVLPVIGYYFFGLSITLLIVSSVGVAAMRMVFTPALQSALPVLIHDRSAMQSINGLFDATYRLARLVGPMVAALLNLFLPVIHFLTAAALGFVASAAAIAATRERLLDHDERPRRVRPGWRGAVDALTSALRLLLGERVMGALILTNAIVNGPWLVALSLAIALIITEQKPSFLGFGGLAAYALVMGAYGVGDVCGNLVAGSLRMRRELSSMFAGYTVMGAGFTFVGLAAWLVPADRLLPALMLGALAGGLGGPFFFVPMVTRLQQVFHGSDIARVYRFRLAVMAASMLLWSALATPLLDAIGAVATEFLCGLVIVAVGVGGWIVSHRHEDRERRSHAAPSPVPGD